MSNKHSKATEALNSAFRADPNAIHALLCNWVPCNEYLANDPLVQVGQSAVLEGQYQVGAIGLINAVLGAYGLPLVAVAFDEVDARGRAKLLGFCDYEQNKE